MASSLGRIALGLVGAVIGAPFGLSAIGFSIGSAIGGMIFAPDGPKVEGPRLGDTNVSASSLGKVIPEHYGVTRCAGNMIWSAGLKEIKKVEEQGGKGGGGGATSTTYSYFCSFAMCFGRGQATQVRRMWADGKLIYDITGTGDVANDKYKFRFHNGSPGQAVDPLVAESINRRLAGMDDVNAGNQEQAKYTTISDLITQSAAGTGQRSAFYASLLAQRKTEAETGLASGAVPDYRFTSAYRDLVYLVFIDMPLEDFGNRIPNITAELVWEGAGTSWSTGSDAPLVTGVAVPEAGANLQVPENLNGFNYTTQKLVAVSGGHMRRFALANRSEEARSSLALTSEEATILNQAVFGSSPILIGGAILPNTGSLSNVKVLATSNNGVVYATATYTHPGLSAPGSRQMLLTFGETGLSITGAVVMSTLPSHAAVLPYTNGGTAIFGNLGTTGAQNGEFLLSATGNTIRFGKMSGASALLSDTVALATTFSSVAVPNAGPVVYAGQSGSSFSASTRGIAVRFGGSAITVARLNCTYSRRNSSDDGTVESINVAVDKSGGRVNPFGAAISHIVGVVADINGNRTYVIAALANDTTGVIGFDANMEMIYARDIPHRAPLADCGLTGYRTAPGTVAFGSGTSIISIDLASGTHVEFANATETAIDRRAQAYIENIRGLLAWVDNAPSIFYIDRGTALTAIAATLPDVVASICRRAGMTSAEFDVSALPNAPVRGLSLTRPGTGRNNLEVLMKAYFIEGVETDWKVKFQPQQTTSVRTIQEKELGQISAPTGKVNWLESRTPEYSLPAQININYSDPMRDYQNGTAHQRRIGAPISSMYSEAIENMELPLVLLDSEAATIAERMLYQSWMNRDASKTVLSWTHADLDPGDMISVAFRDGRVITDRLLKTTLGANFEIEIESVRSGDPVYVPAPNSVIPTGSIPSTTVSNPVPSRMFAFDLPLLFDYHSTGGAALRYYMALGADSDRWRSGAVYLSWDAAAFNNVATVPLDVSWGQVIGRLGKPRALWSTDRENELVVSVVRDRGDITSVTREDILNGANRALVWNSETGIGEVIQFQDVEVVESGNQFILRNLTRGLRGTEYAAATHGTGEYFFLINEATMQVGVMENSRLNTTAYFKGVSAGQLVSSVQPVSMPVAGRSLMPWAPSRVRREVSGSGSLILTWNRRTRLSGAWNMASGIETVPLNEDSEYYEVFLINGDPDAFNPNDPTKYHAKRVVTSPEVGFTATELASYGLTPTSMIGVAIYQVSAQVGRGFGRIGLLAP